MGTKLSRIFSYFVSLSLIICLFGPAIPVSAGGFSAEPYVPNNVEYNAEAAMQYAYSNYNSLPDSVQCAEFVTKCMKQGGGLPISGSTYVGTLYRELIAFDSFTSYQLECTGNYVYANGANAGKISVGDAVFWQRADNDKYPHTMIVTKIDSSGKVYVTGKNGNIRDWATFAGPLNRSKEPNVGPYNGTMRLYVAHYQKLISPTISNPRVENLTSDGFDLVFDLNDTAGFVITEAVCYSYIYLDLDSVSWGNKFKYDGMSIENRNYKYDDHKMWFHFKLLDDYGPTPYKVQNGEMTYVYSNYEGELPNSGISRGPYMTQTRFEYHLQGSDDIYRFSYNCFDENKYVIDLHPQMINPTEGEETTEADNSDNESHDDTPVGDGSADKDQTPGSGSRSFGDTKNTTVQGPRQKQIGETFNVANRNYKVVGDKEIYLTGFSKKDKKFHTGDEMTIDGITYKVTGVSPKAFKGNTKLTEITIGENVEVIGKAAFQGCKNLKTIKIRSRRLRTTYKNSFSGTNKDMKVLVRYKNKLKKYKKLIAKSGVSGKTTYAYKKF
ncbi:leucine-rich repeat protein [Butyrivibrio sp. FC2001]|uniref:leucine-rich repeat protein n=1 Tax=Butyrivibrio sp. FC2001 TaxID=1280671 RepID=UPI000409D97F|nr:leucine-rich repeat protein [Butyrivibrio sp. FC2001]